MKGIGKIILMGVAVAAVVVGAVVLLAEDAANDETSDRPSPNPAATEAAPESEAAAPPGAGEPAELPAGDDAAVRAAVRAYIAALNSGNGAEVCSLLDPSSVRSRDLPSPGGSCGRAVTASIGHRRPGGTPAWKRTTIREITAVSVGEGQARVTATVTHDFADRKYVSVEEDVIYLDRRGDKWLIAKPSGTFYRAVGYPEPPLRALTPP